MKKIIILLTILFIWLFWSYNKWFANRDWVTDIFYGVDISWKFTPSPIKLEKCGEIVGEMSFNWIDLFPILSLIWEGWVECPFSVPERFRKRGMGSFSCGFYANGPLTIWTPRVVDKYVTLSWKYSEIFEKMGIPKEYYKDLTWNYSIKLKMPMGMYVNQAATEINEVKKYFLGQEITYVYTADWVRLYDILPKGKLVDNSDCWDFTDTCSLTVNNWVWLVKWNNKINCNWNKIEIKNKDTWDILKTFDSSSAVYNIRNASFWEYEVICHTENNWACSETKKFEKDPEKVCAEWEENGYELEITDSNCKKNSDWSYNCYAGEKDVSCEVEVKKICEDESEETFTVSLNNVDTKIRLDSWKIVTEGSGKEACKIEEIPTCSWPDCGNDWCIWPDCWTWWGWWGWNWCVWPNCDTTIVKIIPDPEVEDNCAINGEYCFSSQPWWSWWSKQTKYANLEESFDYDLTNITDANWVRITKDMIGSMEVSYCQAFDENSSDCITITDKDWKKVSAKDYLSIETNWLSFKIKAANPFKFSNYFKVTFNKWDLDWKPTNKKVSVLLKNSVRQEFIAPVSIKNIKVSDDNWVTWDWEVDQESGIQKYKLELSGTWELYVKKSQWTIINLKNITKDNFDWNVSLSWSLVWVVERFNFPRFIFPTFSADLIFKDYDDLLSWSQLSLKDLIISYILNYRGKDYKAEYYISWKTDKSCDATTLWAKIEWTLQWDWRVNSTEWKKNYTDLSKQELRTQIRKNAYNLLIWINAWKKVGTVYYFEWNKEFSKITWLNNWDTIILKNWNLIIDTDINKNIWIIVLKDNYKIWDFKSWNVFVLNNVENIKAAIYADGWFMRKEKEMWEKQLKLSWALFTRNTIGWWVDWEKAEYIIPGGKKLWKSGRELSKKYDLNYIRKMKDRCSEASFLIKYDTSIQTNPPKGFENK